MTDTRSPGVVLKETLQTHVFTHGTTQKEGVIIMAIIKPIEFDDEGGIIPPTAAEISQALAGFTPVANRSTSETFDEGQIHIHRIITVAPSSHDAVDIAEQTMGEFLDKIIHLPEYRHLSDRSVRQGPTRIVSEVVYAIETPWQRLRRYFPRRDHEVGQQSAQPQSHAFVVDTGGTISDQRRQITSD